MVRFIYDRGGFTLIEILIAITIMGLVVGGAISVYLMSITAWKEGSVQIALQRKGSLAMEKMVRGVNGRYGIREGRATTLTLVGSDRIEVAVDMNDPPTPGDASDDTTISFYKSGDQLIYDPDTSPTATGDEFPIAENVRTVPPGLTFAVSGGIVTIDLGMQDKVRDKDINVDLSTTVKIRN